MLAESLNQLFASCGYRKYRMQKFEEYDLYRENRDFLKSSQIITFTDLDGSLLALKPDITISIIKNAEGPQKVYYNEMVYRASDHHYREMPQAGIERIGVIDAYGEAEVISLAAKSLSMISPHYALRLSDVGLMRSLLDHFRIEDETREEVIGAIAAKNADLLRRMKAEGKLDEEAQNVLIDLINLYMPLKEGVKHVKGLLDYEEAEVMLEHLETLAEILTALGVKRQVYLDFSLVNSMDYYNGIIFQGDVKEIPFTVLSGGRYDRLPQKMGKAFEAIGFAIYMDIVENNLPAVKKKYDGDCLIVYKKSDDPVLLAKTVNAFLKRGLTVLAVRSDQCDKALKARWKRTLKLKDAFAEVEHD